MWGRAIRTSIDHYLAGRTTLSQLEGWLVGNLQAILDSHEGDAVTLADALDADLVEFGEGLLDARELLDRLAGYNRAEETIYVSVGQPRESLKTEGRNVSIRKHLDVWTTTTLTPRLRYV